MESWLFVALVVLIASGVIVTILFAIPWLTIKLSQEGPNIVKAIALFLFLSLLFWILALVFLPSGLYMFIPPIPFIVALIYFIGDGETKSKE